MGNWKEYFMRLLGAVKYKVLKRNKRERGEREKDVEEDINSQES